MFKLAISPCMFCPGGWVQIYQIGNIFNHPISWCSRWWLMYWRRWLMMCPRWWLSLRGSRAMISIWSQVLLIWYYSYGLSKVTCCFLPILCLFLLRLVPLCGWSVTQWYEWVSLIKNLVLLIYSNDSPPLHPLSSSSSAFSSESS